MTDTDTPRWRLVRDHGQPTADDYPILVLPKVNIEQAYVRHHPVAEWSVLSHGDRWCPVTLPVGDEPRPLPAPWRPMSKRMPSTRIVVVAGSNGGLYLSHGSVTSERDGVAWCLPSDLHPLGGAS